MTLNLPTKSNAFKKTTQPHPLDRMEYSGCVLGNEIYLLGGMSVDENDQVIGKNYSFLFIIIIIIIILKLLLIRSVYSMIFGPLT